MTDTTDGTPFDPAMWERRAGECRDAIDQLAWLVGRWRGRGETSEGPRTSEVEHRLMLDGTFFESRERIFDADGGLVHEDLTIYGASPESQGGLWAHLYIPGGILTRYRVTVFGETMLCEPETLGARLSFLREDDGYRVRIYFPGERGSWVEDSSLVYERIGRS